MVKWMAWPAVIGNGVLMFVANNLYVHGIQIALLNAACVAMLAEKRP
mgnify:CR=1 FL=1